MFPEHTVSVFEKDTMGDYLSFHAGVFVSRFQPHANTVRLHRDTRGLGQVLEANNE